MLAAGKIVDVDKEKKWGENATLRNASVEGERGRRSIGERKEEGAAGEEAADPVPQFALDAGVVYLVEKAF